MRILLLAPQPFFVDRGTPIAVRAVATALCEAGHTVDLVSFHGGCDIELHGLRHFRIARPLFVGDVPVGLSWQKLLCNVGLFLLARRLIRRTRYDCIHAVEDSVFLALILRRIGRISLIYDMDSIMSDQIVEKYPFLGWCAGLMRRLERAAMRSSDLVICVCPALAERATVDAPMTPRIVLHDYPILGDATRAPPIRSDDPSRLLALYVGNLQPYQGVDLLREASYLLPPEMPLDLVVVGGLPEDREQHSVKPVLPLNGVRVRYLGPMPLTALTGLLAQADILLSPRRSGVNTPMKIYSYMQSGQAILATSIMSHTQVLDESCACIVVPTGRGIAAGLQRLASDPNLRLRIGAAAQARVQSKYSKACYDSILSSAYDQISKRTGE